MAAAQPIRNIQSEKDFGQVERAREQRQMQQGDRKRTERNKGSRNAERNNVRNTSVTRFGDQTTRTGGQGSPSRQAVLDAYPDTASIFNDEYGRAGIQPSNIDAAPKRGGTDQTRGAQVAYEKRVTKQPVAVQTKSGKIKLKKKKVISAAAHAKRELARVRVTGINLWVMGISSVFFIPMLVLSVVSTISLGLAYYVEWLFGTAIVDNKSDIITVDGVAREGLLAMVGNAIVDLVYKVPEALFKLVNGLVKYTVGIDLTIFNPMNVFSITYAASVGMGIFLLLLMYIIYTFSLIKCLSGTNAHTKQIAFMISFIGHSIPVVNALPWFMVWAVAVWFNPK